MKKHSSWLALVVFCTAAIFAAALGLTILLAGGTIAFAVGGASNERSSAVSGGVSAGNDGSSDAAKTYAGIITDSHCGARHAIDSGKTANQCAMMCVRAGSRYALVDGDMHYFLAGSEDTLDRLAGERATIAGALDGDTIHVISVSTQ